jgi:paraquat-inducible protein B
MSKKSNPTLIGGFVVGAVALLASAVVLFGGSELLAKRAYYVAYFEEQTKGLRVGSNVILNGVRVGYVSEVALLIDETEFETMTRVTLEILPDTYVPLRDGKPVSDDVRDVISHEVLLRDAGLRAQLEVESFVTGQLLIRLDMRPDTPIELSGLESEHPEIPTIRSNIQEMLARLQEWMTSIREDVDIEGLAEAAEGALQGFAALTNSSDLHDGLSGLNALINDQDTQALGTSLRIALDEISVAAEQIDTFLGDADDDLASLAADLKPVLAKLGSTLESAEQTIDAARLQLGGDSEQAYQLQSTLREIEGAAVALREFFDYLERNPEALIRGKQEP